MTSRTSADTSYSVVVVGTLLSFFPKEGKGVLYQTFLNLVVRVTKVDESIYGR